MDAQQQDRLSRLAARGRVSSAAERNCANVTFFARNGLITDRDWIEALGRLASRNALIRGDEG